MGRPGRISETRKLSIPNRPYFVVYVVAGDVVEITQVIHARRKWP